MGALYSSLRNCLKKWKYRDNSAASPAEAEEMSDLFFELRILQVATNFFSDMNLLGHGGFGPVFKADLLTYTWKLFQEGKSLELVDGGLAKCNPDEAAMCIQLGLLCCQATVAERPTMSYVHLILCSESFSLAQPGKPGVHGRRWIATTNSSSAITNTNPSSSYTGKTLTGSTVEDLSRNSISLSSLDEGR
ncbi:hypothetical protein BVRB_5g111040 [Beta vulgaris subsp. vulgaris]|nr:hypothetical protein BVRB_5g111040 [Beta vulgaris subsp. vulgaris]